MPFYRQNARFDPEGRLSPRCAIPRLPVRHKYIPGIGAATRTPHRYRCCPVSKFHPPPSPASIDRRHTAFDPVDQSAAGWGTGRRRVESAGHVPDTSFPGSVRKQTPNDPVRSAAPSSPTLVCRGCRLPPHPPAADGSPNPPPTGPPGRWNGSYGRTSARAHVHANAHMHATTHVPPSYARFACRRF